ncbi:arylamine N-acetyltransferase [Vibrio harveyi]|uniref:arylamine N-acetyltransferase family protein n=1 Tax=Vibrio TaxID=662 RepID=UPI00053953B6|nr:arylamine N-acetyltransferase [Vibrio harveyi]AIV07879.1 N-hydroxyarylamine O-acetyltransferase [Vibrio harveyi]EKO3851918.1 arylamine N-acetyltransferase [Vibrio harveyi]WCP82889.1 arylamine N-acetyltransferase [Vibrio harveyi]HDM8151863.1 arylamine N-acetyltransferase [Vibrio harveyi]HDM8156753.1 arylamine N-acetyltransferase [Vibrio harveyi]
MNQTDLQAYLKKVGISQSLNINTDTLLLLHNAQHRRLPFENFDISLGRGISVAEQDIINKLIYRERGGYCYELNALLFNVLKTIGFDARPLLGRVHLSGTPSGRTHQFTLVTMGEDKWIVDVGFGSNTPRAPLPFVLNQDIHTDLQTFRFIEHELVGYMLQVQSYDDPEQWIDLYSLDFEHVFDGDIVCGNHYTSTSPNSHFTSSRVATLATDSGIITLFNHSLKYRANGEVVEIELEAGETYLSALKTHFGIALDADYSSLKPV